jgi:hypothetical protein
MFEQWGNGLAIILRLPGIATHIAWALLISVMIILACRPALADEWVSNYWREPVRHQVILYRIRSETLQHATTVLRYRLHLERQVQTRELRLQFITYIRTSKGTLITRATRSTRQLVGPMPDECTVCVKHKGAWFDDTRRRWKRHFNWSTGLLISQQPWQPSGEPLLIENQNAALGIQQRVPSIGVYELTLRPVDHAWLKSKLRTKRFVSTLKLRLRPSVADAYWTDAKPADLTLRIPMWKN